MTTKRAIRIQLLRHEGTGLLAATSEDLYGLAVHGHSEEEIQRLLPVAIRELLEAEGFHVLSLDVAEDDRLSRAGFGLPAFIANAALTDARRDA